jgi:hypothetical protein
MVSVAAEHVLRQYDTPNTALLKAPSSVARGQVKRRSTPGHRLPAGVDKAIYYRRSLRLGRRWYRLANNKQTVYMVGWIGDRRPRNAAGPARLVLIAALATLDGAGCDYARCAPHDRIRSFRRLRAANAPQAKADNEVARVTSPSRLRLGCSCSRHVAAWI